MGRRTIEFKPYPIQYKALKYLMDDKTTQILFGGAARVSKSYLLCLFSVYYCLKYDGIHGAICREELSKLTKTTLVTLFEVFKDYNLKEGVDFKFNRTNSILEFTNGSKLFFLELKTTPSDPNFERLMSLSLTFACVDEASQIEELAINRLQTRLSHKLKEFKLIPKLLIVSNPTRGWLYEQYYKPFKEGTLPEHRKVVLGLPTDNPSVDKSYLKMLENLDEVTVQVFRWGNWEFDEDDFQLYGYDDVQYCFYNESPLTGNTTINRYITCDVANVGKNKSVIYIWNGWEALDIISIAVNTTPQLVEKIKELMRLYAVPVKNVCIDADGVGIGVVDYLPNSYAFRGNGVPYNNENYNNLRSQCYYKLAEIVKQKGLKLPLGKFEVEIIQELQHHKRYKVDNGGKVQITPKEDIKKKIGRSPDYSDALMMRCVYEYKQGKGKLYVYVN